MEANFNNVSKTPNKYCTVIEVLNLPAYNIVMNFPRVSRAEFLRKEDKLKETLIKGYWKIKQLKK
jgi:hypothetical protein